MLGARMSLGGMGCRSLQPFRWFWLGVFVPSMFLFIFFYFGSLAEGRRKGDRRDANVVEIIITDDDM